MKPRICICCGELMPELGNALSRNPNLCASCSSMADGMGNSDRSDLPEATAPAEPQPPPAHSAPELAELVRARG